MSLFVWFRRLSDLAWVLGYSFGCEFGLGGGL